MFKYKTLVLTTILIIILATANAAEIRSLWVLPWSINTPEAIDTVIKNAVANNQNELLLEVRYRSDALYQTNRVEDDYPNPEPQSYIMHGLNFDPLAYAIEQGHKHNLMVQAWVIVFNATPLLPELVSKNYMYNNHRDWFTWDKAGRTNSKNQEFGYFIDPGIPDVQTHLLNVFGDLASGYPDLDGIHLDYIRYPDANHGFHPISKARFNMYHEINPLLTWNEWRIMQVSQFVERLHTQLRGINPNLLLTAAVFADYNDAVKGLGQDWLDWLNRGIIDRVYPMHYKQNDREFLRILDEIKLFYQNDKIVMGLRAWDAAGNSLTANSRGILPAYNVRNVVDRINWSRDANFAGIALFSYDGLLKGKALDYLGTAAYSDNAADLAFINEAQTAALDTVPMTEDTPHKEGLAPDLTIVPLLEQYSMYIFVPTGGRWNMQFYDADDKLVYQRSRYYDSGSNTDHWDGLLNDGSKLDDGKYYARLYREQDRFMYLIPINVQRIWE